MSEGKCTDCRVQRHGIGVQSVSEVKCTHCRVQIHGIGVQLVSVLRLSERDDS